MIPLHKEHIIIAVDPSLLHAVIDLSQYTPDQLLEADRLDIPACPFNETSSDVSPSTSQEDKEVPVRETN